MNQTVKIFKAVSSIALSTVITMIVIEDTMKKSMLSFNKSLERELELSSIFEYVLDLNKGGLK